jgi:RNA polymerase sigma-70 factor (ECF subfamily)
MDEENFKAFYEQTARNLRGYLRSMLTDHGAVDDLLQESYFRLLNAALPESMEPAHRKNYLYRIATNLVHDNRRSRKPEHMPKDPPATGMTSSLDTTHDVGRAFERLKPRERDVLWMAYVECMSHNEIAGILRIGSASVRPALARARAKFAQILRRGGVGV